MENNKKVYQVLNSNGYPMGCENNEDALFTKQEQIDAYIEYLKDCGDDINEEFKVVLYK